MLPDSVELSTKSLAWGVGAQTVAVFCSAVVVLLAGWGPWLTALSITGLQFIATVALSLLTPE